MFSVDHGGWTNQLWLVSVADSKLTSVTVSGYAAEPRFGPADDELYWSGLTMEGSGAIWRAAVRRRARDVESGQAAVVLPIDGGVADGVSIARDGTLAYGVTNEDANLWALDVPLAGEPGAPIRLTDDGVRNTHPDYSTDGQIAYIQRVPGRPIATWIMREDGTHREPLAVDVTTNDPQWSRDASRLLVRRGEQGGEWGWIDVATRRTSPLPFSAQGMQSAQISPDGRELTYHMIQKDGRINVWTRPIDGGAPRQVTFDTEAINYPAWSPDGKWLAVEVKRGDNIHIGVVPREGGPMEMLTEGFGQNWPRSWSPDGESIAFAGERGGVWNVWQVARRTKAMTMLTHFTSASGYVRYPVWSPRSRRMVFERSVRTSSVWTAAVAQPRVARAEGRPASALPTDHR